MARTLPRDHSSEARLLCGNRRLHQASLIRLAAFAAPIALALAAFCIAFARRVPGDVERPLAPGIVYVRESATVPRQIVAHMVWIDLSNPDVRFLVTPPEYAGQAPFAAMTVEEFANHYDLIAAINGDYFSPWHNTTPLDYYPRSRDPVTTLGYSASKGEEHAPEKPGYFGRRNCTLFLSENGLVQFETPPDRPFNAISGGPILLREGRIADFPPSQAHPQTAVGYDPFRQRLLLAVIDGRQPGYSEGLTNHELARFLNDRGCQWALRLDGGGSSALAARSLDEKDSPARLLNSPIHSGIPGLQRPVANHLGVYLR